MRGRGSISVLGSTCVAVAAALAIGVAGASAADECRGLQVCLPLAGPWVAIPAGSPTVAPVAQYELRCPRRGYLVAGTDVRLSDRQIDVGFRGETGSPVGPGTTTQDAVLFTGFYAGGAARPTFFRPFIGCVPTQGGGARSETAHRAAPEGLKPTRPVTRIVVNRSLPAGTTRVVARCTAATRLVGGSSAVGFRLASPPTAAAGAGVRTDLRSGGNAIVVTATVQAAALASKPVVQVLALCTRATP